MLIKALAKAFRVHAETQESASLDNGYVDSQYSRTAVKAIETTYSAAQGHIDTDVCVIGGGFAGLGTALSLAEKSATVVLVRRERERETMEE